MGPLGGFLKRLGVSALIGVRSRCSPHPAEEKRTSWRPGQADAQDVKCRVQSVSAARGVTAPENEQVPSFLPPSLPVLASAEAIDKHQRSPGTLLLPLLPQQESSLLVGRL